LGPTLVGRLSQADRPAYIEAQVDPPPAGCRGALTSKSPVARLAEAVLGLEEDLRAADETARSLANELVRLGDALAREMANDVDILVKQLLDELAEEVDRISRAVRSEYEARIAAEVERAERLGRENLDAAAEAVVEEIIKLVSGG